MRIVSADFLSGATDVRALPNDDSFEIAVIGRSNAGKSTILNRLFGRKNLARVSSTPGKTTEINVYKVRLRSEGVQDVECRFIDLPGYGYAKRSLKERETFGRIIVSFIQERKNLKLAFLLMDIRREVQDEEMAIWDLISPIGVIVLTKADKISKNAQSKARSEVSQALGISENRVLISGEKIPPTPLFNAIIEAFNS